MSEWVHNGKSYFSAPTAGDSSRSFLTVASTSAYNYLSPQIDPTPDISAMIEDALAKYQPAIAVVKCKHCGQWGARFCECKKCGAPIE